MTQKSLTQQMGYILRVVRRNVRAKSSANAYAAIQQEEGHDREIGLRLDNHPVILQVLKNPSILLAEDFVRDRLKIGEDVSGRGRVLAT
jgi:hypothetical protein